MAKTTARHSANSWEWTSASCKAACCLGAADKAPEAEDTARVSLAFNYTVSE